MGGLQLFDLEEEGVGDQAGLGLAAKAGPGLATADVKQHTDHDNIMELVVKSAIYDIRLGHHTLQAHNYHYSCASSSSMIR